MNQWEHRYNKPTEFLRIHAETGLDRPNRGFIHTTIHITATQPNNHQNHIKTRLAIHNECELIPHIIALHLCHN